MSAARTLLIVTAPLLALVAAAACDSDGVTPVCSPEGGECATPPGEIIPTKTTGAGGSGGASAGEEAGSAGSAGTSAILRDAAAE